MTDLRWRAWKWLQTFATKRLRSRWMDFHRHDRQCGNCKVWLSETYGVELVRDVDFIQFTTCRNCNHETAWDCRFMIPVQISETDPILDKYRARSGG